MRAKILIVDDDREILLGLENRVTWMGHEPVTADNGKDALRLIEQGDFDLVLLDYDLSGLDSGPDILERVKGDLPSKRDTEEEVRAAYREPFIIILTSLSDIIDPAVLAMRLGAFDFLAKPFSADRMTVVVTKALAAVAIQRQVNVLRQEIDGRSDSLKTGSPPRHYHDSMAAYSRKIIDEALRRNGGNLTRAAEELGLQRTYLKKLIRQNDTAAEELSDQRTLLMKLARLNEISDSSPNDSTTSSNVKPL